MIFVYASIPIALVGAEPRTKADARSLLENAISANRRLVTDAAVVEEILVHCLSVECREAIEPAIDVLMGVVDDVLPVEEADVLRAREMLYGPERPSARNSLHLAIIERHAIGHVMSLDLEYDRYPDVMRLSPSG